MDTTLSILSPALDQQTLDTLVRDLCADINNETDVAAALAEEPGGLGARGDITLPTLMLTFLTGRGVVALINVLKSYVEREQTLEITLQKNGRKFSIKTQNVTPSLITQTIEDVNRVLREL